MSELRQFSGCSQPHIHCTCSRKNGFQDYYKGAACQAHNGCEILLKAFFHCISTSFGASSITNRASEFLPQSLIQLEEGYQKDKSVSPGK